MTTLQLSINGHRNEESYAQANAYQGTVIWRPDGKDVVLLLDEPQQQAPEVVEVVKKEREEKAVQWWPYCGTCKGPHVKKIPNSKLWQCSSPACGAVDFPIWEKKPPLYTRNDFEADMSTLDDKMHRARKNLLTGKMNPWEFLKFERIAEAYERQCKGKLLMTRTFLDERSK